MGYKVIDGSAFLASQKFLDEDDQPLIPKPGFPKIKVLDADNDVVTSAVANPSPQQTWEATISLPFLGVSDSVEWRVKWLFKSEDDEKIKTFEDLEVMPAVDGRYTDVVVLKGKANAKLTLPQKVVDGDETDCSMQIYKNNDPELTTALSLADSSVELKKSKNKTVVKFPVPEDLEPSFNSNLIVVDVDEPQQRQYTYRLWISTPQMLKASSMLEDFLNKARIANVIPELEYTQGDLMSYLERGLYIFNGTAIPTAFTGTNMQGALLDAWLTCAQYYALSSQLIAEGSLAFNFSGQSVTLDVDRTPQLDSALGRVEARIQDTVVPLKKQMAANGILAGDGSIGSTSMKNPLAIGTVGLANMPTTRMGGFGVYTGYYVNRRSGAR